MPATYTVETRKTINEEFSDIAANTSGTGALSGGIEQAVVDLAVRSQINSDYMAKMESIPSLSIIFENSLI